MPCSLQDQGVRCQHSMAASRREDRPCRLLPERVQQWGFTAPASRRKHRPCRPLPESVQQWGFTASAFWKEYRPCRPLPESVQQWGFTASAFGKEYRPCRPLPESVQRGTSSERAPSKHDLRISLHQRRLSVSASRKDDVSVNVSVNVSVQGENPSASASEKKGCHCQPPPRKIFSSSLWEGSLFFLTPSDENVEFQPSVKTLLSIVTQETGIVCSISFQCRRYSVSSFSRNAHRRTCCLCVVSPGKVSSSCLCPVCCCLFSLVIPYSSMTRLQQ